MADREAQVAGTPVRGRWRDLDPSAGEGDPNKAFAQYISAAPVTPLGHARQTITDTAASITSIPEGTKRLHIYNLSEDTDVYWTDYDGQTPGSDLGFPIPAGGYQLYDSEVTEDLLFATVSGSAELAFAFYA